VSRSQTKEVDRQCWQASAPDCTGVLELSLRMTDEMQWLATGFRAFRGCPVHRRQRIIDVIFSSSSPRIRCQCSQAPTQSRTDAPFHPCDSPPNNRPVPCRDPDQQPPSAQDVLTHSSSPSPILPNRRQRDYSQRSWRLYCVPRQLRVLHQFLWHPSSIVGFSQNETRRGRSSSSRWSKGIV